MGVSQGQFHCGSKEKIPARFEVLRVVLLKLHVFWDALLCCGSKQAVGS